MLFSVIYDFDCPREVSVRHYLPPNRHLWQQTEGDESRNYDYLEGRCEKCKHRKLCAVLTKEQFREFVDHVGLYAEETETMGSLGAPGFGFGWAPAISFRGDDEDAIQSADVTPLPTRNDTGAPIRANGNTERDWSRIRNAVIAAFS
jgi:hypothetical protein